MTIYKPDITQEILRRLTNGGPNSYLKLYECVKIQIERSISFRDYSHHLDKMYEKKWLVKTDEFEGKRGKRISIRITSEGELAFRHNILLEDWDLLTKGVILLLLVSTTGIYHKEKISKRKIEPGSIVENDPLTGGSTYFDPFLKKGIRISEITKKLDYKYDMILSHIDFTEDEISDIFIFLKDKNLVNAKLVEENGKEIPEYYISQNFSDFIHACNDLLTYNELQLKDWYSYVKNHIYDPKRNKPASEAEQSWLLKVYGKKKLDRLRIYYNLQRKVHVSRFKRIVKEMKRGKNLFALIHEYDAFIDINQNRIPFVSFPIIGNRMHAIDGMIKSKYEEVMILHQQLTKFSNYALYADLILNICHPEFLRIQFANEFLKFYELRKQDVGIYE